MINTHSNYDNMHRSGISYVLIFINNNLMTIISCMLSMSSGEARELGSGVEITISTPLPPPLFIREERGLLE